MENTQPQQPSPFALMVDGLRHKSDEEIKLLYLRFFAKDLENEWKSITSEADFANASEEDIVGAIQKNRYRH